MEITIVLTPHPRVQNMEGLHHDTIVDEEEEDPPIKEQGALVEEEQLDGNREEDFSNKPINRDLTPDERVNLYEQMVRIRRFEERSLRAYQQGHIGGFLHLYIGQEAVAVGSVSAMAEDDHVITAYRDHGHALAVGMNMDECMAELYGKKTGCSKGKGGSMHFFRSRQELLGRARYRRRANPTGFGHSLCPQVQ